MTELQTSVEANGLERKMRVQVPADRIDQEVETRLKKVGRTASLKGFRPGKVPASVIRKRYGGQVRQEVLQEMLQSSYSEALDREQLQPAGGPTIEPETVDEGQDLTYVATFEIYPEFELSGLDSLKIEAPEAAVEDGDIQKMLDNLREQNADWTEVDRKASEGDQVTVDFSGTLKGEPIEGGSGEDVPIVIGGGQMLPEFDKNLSGASAGDEKTFKVKFPKDYHAEHLAGQKAEFAVTVKSVSEKSLPELDEEFVKRFGIDSGQIDDLRADIRKNMERECDAKLKAELKRLVMEQLLEANPIDVPSVMIDEEAQRLRTDTMRQMGITDEAQAPAPESFRETAERRVRLGLLVASVIRDNELEADGDRVKARVDEMAAPYDQPDQIRKMYFQSPELLQSVESSVLEEQVVDWLLSKSAVTNKTISFDELMGL